MSGVYSIGFQVWRPSPTFATDGCHSLVGYNYFENITLVTEETVLERPELEDQITVQPGDTIGFYLTSNRDDDDGIQIDQTTNQEIIWYSVGTFVANNDTMCLYPVDNVLTPSTNKNPIISVNISEFL